MPTDVVLLDRPMPSFSLQRWFAERASALNEMERAHQALRGSGPGVRAASLQINQAYTMMLSGQFQGYCRAFHDECAELLVGAIADSDLRDIAMFNLTTNRKLDRGNPNAGHIGADFGRFRLPFWSLVAAHHSQNSNRRMALDDMNEWRNAIGHQDFAPAMLRAGRPTLQLARVQAWRSACDALARSFEEVMRTYIRRFAVSVPW